jgi:regulation of enolase protein 1 (concanavalin A-like superfamily)
MHRFAVLLLCALLAVAGGVAAPAPLSRPSEVWSTGWDRPVDPVGDCRFERKGDKLTLTVPAREGRKTPPRLLRDVEGDFVVQVRVCPSGHRAGLVLTGGLILFCFERSDGPVPLVVTNLRKTRSYREGPPLAKPAYLQLTRQDDLLRVAYSEDGKAWIYLRTRFVIKPLPQGLKVGVVAEATAEGTFKAVFDQWKLSPLEGTADTWSR